MKGTATIAETSTIQSENHVFGEYTRRYCPRGPRAPAAARQRGLRRDVRRDREPKSAKPGAAEDSEETQRLSSQQARDFVLAQVRVFRIPISRRDLLLNIL